MADSLFGIPHIAYAKAQVNRNKSLDVSKLDVSFGGFTPMPLNDGMATREQVLSTEARIRERREAALRAQALQDACTSDSRHFVDDAGTDWEYVVFSGPRSASSVARMRKARLQSPIQSRVCRFARWRPMLARA